MILSTYANLPKVTGSHEVVGSIPISSTTQPTKRVSQGLTFFYWLQPVAIKFLKTFHYFAGKIQVQNCFS